MPKKRVLCAVDFSQGSDRAVAKACEIARRFDEELELIHVYPLPPLPIPEDKGLSRKTIGLVSDGAPEKLEQLKADLSAQGVRCKASLIGGDPAQVLIECAELPDVEMLVMGCHGRTGVRRLVMGSVAEHVVRRAIAPVLTVRMGATG